MPSCVQEARVGVSVKVLPRLALRCSYLSLATLGADTKPLEGHWPETREQDAGLKAIWEPAVQISCNLAEQTAVEKLRPESDWNLALQVF